MTIYRLVESLVRRCLHVLFRGRVQAGPFQGMLYSVTSYGGWYPKIFGSYEYKVQEWLIDRLKATQSPLFWDVGAAEGFYAIGAAMHNANVVAWEGETPQRETICTMAKANGVAARIDLHGYCIAGDLLSRVQSEGAPSIVLMDTEGHETDLITDALLAQCKDTSFLIELHGEDAVKHVCETFRDAGLHGQLFDHAEWGIDRWPHFQYLPKSLRKLMLTERRAPGGNPYFVYVPTYSECQSDKKSLAS